MLNGKGKIDDPNINSSSQEIKMKYFLPNINWINEGGRSCAFLEASLKKTLLRQGTCFDEPLLGSIKAESLLL